MLQALSRISPTRQAEGHYMRFEALPTQDGLFCFTGRGHNGGEVNIRRIP